MNNPFLTGENIYLRIITIADLTPRYRDWFNDAEVCKGNSHHQFPNYDEDMHTYYERAIKSRENLILAICDKATDLHIGNVSLQSIDPINRSAEFAIVIGDKNYWGKGVGTEVMRLIVSHGFHELNLNRIELGTFDDNIGMQKLATKSGFKEEGRSRQAVWKEGRWKDILHFGLLRDEWKDE